MSMMDFGIPIRSLHPLQLLLDAEAAAGHGPLLYSHVPAERLAAFVSFRQPESSAVMIGHHAAAFILDTYMKGYRDFDVEQAYEAMRKNATEATCCRGAAAR